jgi:chaperonin GroES
MANETLTDAMVGLLGARPLLWLLGIRAIRREGDAIGAAGTRRGFAMTRRTPSSSTKLETIEPVGKRVLIRKDADKKHTKGGIELPDSVEIPTITGRVVAVSTQIENDEDFSIRQYDRILFNPKHAIPVDFESDNKLFVVPIDDVVAVFRKSE